jgi:ATP-binding cassette subfamily F protein 3
MITFKNLSLYRGSKLLFDKIDVTFHAKQKIGIVGKNGTGKTSLFALIQGRLTPDKGELFISKNLKIATVEQEMQSTSDRIILDYIIDTDTEFRHIEKELEKAIEANDGNKISTLHEQLHAIEGYTIEARAASLLNGLGFSSEQLKEPVKAFSGGWQMRLNLARALMQRSDILLLDEPTNHLDLEAVLWLESWLQKYPGLLLLISHDIEVLDHVVKHIAHVEHHQIQLYTGNFTHFEKERAEQLSLQQRQHEKQQKEIAHIQKFIDRFRYKASKARQAQSRIKMLERMKKVAAVYLDNPFTFRFLEPATHPSLLLTLEEVSLGYKENESILTHIDFQIMRGDRIGLLGPNGAGKTTFMKLLAHQLTPQSGLFNAHPQLKIGYFAQHILEKLNLQQSPLEQFQEIAPKETELALRKYLGRFNFSKETVNMPVKSFSGGEKARLALALIIWDRPNLLLLDEPTNHLDIEVRQALIMALQAFEGAMIIVSHDRFLLKNIADKLFLVFNKRIQPFTGDLDDYRQWLITHAISSTGEEETSPKKTLTMGAQKKQATRELRLLANKIRTLEFKIDTHRHRLQILDQEISNPCFYETQSPKAQQKIFKERDELIKDLELLEKEWCTLQS